MLRHSVASRPRENRCGCQDIQGPSGTRRSPQTTPPPPVAPPNDAAAREKLADVPEVALPEMPMPVLPDRQPGRVSLCPVVRKERARATWVSHRFGLNFYTQRRFTCRILPCSIRRGQSVFLEFAIISCATLSPRQREASSIAGGRRHSSRPGYPLNTNDRVCYRRPARHSPACGQPSLRSVAHATLILR